MHRTFSLLVVLCLGHVLLISSRNPADLVATNIVARTRLSPAAIRRFLDHSSQPVRWSVVRGGVLGGTTS